MTPPLPTLPRLPTQQPTGCDTPLRRSEMNETIKTLRARWTGEGLRWRIAWVLDRLPGQCWADLVSWVQRSDLDSYGDEWWARLRGRLPWRPRARTGRTPGSCEGDAARCGTCYCGKVRTAEADAQMRAGGANPGVIVPAEAAS